MLKVVLFVCIAAIVHFESASAGGYGGANGDLNLGGYVNTNTATGAVTGVVGAVTGGVLGGLAGGVATGGAAAGGYRGNGGRGSHSGSGSLTGALVADLTGALGSKGRAYGQQKEEHRGRANGYHGANAGVVPVVSNGVGDVAEDVFGSSKSGYKGHGGAKAYPVVRGRHNVEEDDEIYVASSYDDKRRSSQPKISTGYFGADSDDFEREESSNFGGRGQGGKKVQIVKEKTTVIKSVNEGEGEGESRAAHNGNNVLQIDVNLNERNGGANYRSASQQNQQSTVINKKIVVAGEGESKQEGESRFQKSNNGARRYQTGEAEAERESYIVKAKVSGESGESNTESNKYKYVKQGEGEGQVNVIVKGESGESGESNTESNKYKYVKEQTIIKNVGEGEGEGESKKVNVIVKGKVNGESGESNTESNKYKYVKEQTIVKNVGEGEGEGESRKVNVIIKGQVNGESGESNTESNKYKYVKQGEGEGEGVLKVNVYGEGEGEGEAEGEGRYTKIVNVVPYPAVYNPLTYGELGRRQSYVSQNFTITMNRVKTENAAATGGYVRRLTQQNMAALQDMSSSLKYLKPCSIVLPHYHPRGSELIHVKKLIKKYYFVKLIYKI